MSIKKGYTTRERCDCGAKALKNSIFCGKCQRAVMKENGAKGLKHVYSMKRKWEL